MKGLVAEIILPLPLTQTFSYNAENFKNDIVVGMRVIVPFGKRKFYTGIVYKLKGDDIESLKEISSLIEDYPIIYPKQIQLWEWISNYYQCSLGEVFKAALPAGLKIESETYITKNEFENTENLTEKENYILNTVGNRTISLAELIKNDSHKNLFTTIRNLQKKGFITLSEELTPNYKAKTETFVKINPILENSIEKTLDSLKKTPKQLQLFSTLIELLTIENTESISKRDLLAISKCTNTIFNELRKKDIIVCFEKKISRLKTTSSTRIPFKLNPNQQIAFEKIQNEFKEKNTVLLHGITSCGKTEIYIHLIEETLKKQQQVLFLVPEIALTTQLSERLKQVFGNRIGIYHSRFSDAERIEVWDNLYFQKGYEIILGVRSSIFLPFKNLGLIIVDEEHDSSYKQYDPAPRYYAKNAAIVLGIHHNAKVLLGTATPSIESYCNTLTGKFGLVELFSRHENIDLPKIEIIDLQQAYHRKQMKGHFSFPLLERMKEKLQAGEQIILFQNRRGFSPYTECKQCAWVPRCPNCDVSLTYHKKFNKLNCHYCGYLEPMPNTCPSCKQPTLQTKGFGTEQIETEVAELFPEIKTIRMDLDTTTSKKAYEQIIYEFESQQAQILIGTQIITKGLDFGNVGMVAILNADNLLNYPDFRAHERAFQMLTQVSGRAGRKGKQGLVLLQTFSPQHSIIQYTKNADFKSFFKNQMAERQLFHYPPFYRLIVMELKHKDASILSKAAYKVAKILQQENIGEILGPSNPPVSRIQSFFIKHILIKFENNLPNSSIKNSIQKCLSSLKNSEEFKQLRVNLDVDPM
ncbi:MAG: primosomal protein N' [Paludibacteraceae bacterium]|nr:primosomal protein N' [Paludibacteraceae bacterium]